MKKRLFIIFFISLFMTGCWNYHELSDLAIITSLGIDKIDDNYELSLLVANNANNDNDKINSKYTVVSGIGKTINLAYDNVRSKMSKDAYLGHLSLVLIDDDIAKESIYPVIEAIVRDPETVKKLRFVIAKDYSSKEILKTISPLDTFPSQNIISNIDNSIQVLGISHNVILGDIIYKLINYGYDNIIPSISISGNVNNKNSTKELEEIENNSNIIIDDIAIFNKDKLIGYLDENKSKIYNILTNKAISLTISIPCYKDNDKFILLKINDPKTKILLNKNTLTYNINTKLNASILETNCNLKIKEKEVIDEIAKSANNKINNLIKETINYSIDNNSDFLGFGNILYKKDYNLFKEKENTYLNNLKYNIKTDIKIVSIGALDSILKDDVK